MEGTENVEERKRVRNDQNNYLKNDGERCSARKYCRTKVAAFLTAPSGKLQGCRPGRGARTEIYDELVTETYKQLGLERGVLKNTI